MGFMLEIEVYELLKSKGFPLPKYRLACNMDEAEKAAQEIGYPVVMKIVSEAIIHKSDIGCVKLGLMNIHDVREAFEDIMAAAHNAAPTGKHKGVLISQMVKGGAETIIGLGTDPEFGRFIMFGLGGTFVEVFKDIAFRLVPLSRQAAEDMIKEIRGYALLRGYRGENPKDIESLTDLLLQCSRLAEAYPAIKEMDLNPVTVREDGVFILDARIKLEDDKEY